MIFLYDIQWVLYISFLQSPPMIPPSFFRYIHFFSKKFFFNLKKFWRQNYIKMGIGDWDQKWVFWKSLEVGA
jgi:hypothetical protein